MANAKQFIKVFEKEAYQALSRIEKEQHPFAFAKSITDVAQGAVESVQSRTRQAFDLKTEFIPKGIRRTSAKKSEIKSMGRTKAVIFTQKRISGFMPIHEEGGDRDPYSSGGKDKGVSFAIPSEMQGERMETKTGKTKKRFKPGELLKNYRGRTTFGRPRGKAGRKRGPFIIHGKKSNVPMIVRRRGKKRYPLEILYIFTNRAKYKPEWEFEETVQNYVETHFPSIYKQNLAEAVRTAK